MLREEEGLSGGFTSRSSRQKIDRCGWAARTGGYDDLRSGESEFLHKRNSKEDK
jgi:hypothetical protein